MRCSMTSLALGGRSEISSFKRSITSALSASASSGSSRSDAQLEPDLSTGQGSVSVRDRCVGHRHRPLAKARSVARPPLLQRAMALHELLVATEQTGAVKFSVESRHGIGVTCKRCGVASQAREVRSGLVQAT